MVKKLRNGKSDHSLFFMFAVSEYDYCCRIVLVILTLLVSHKN